MARGLFGGALDDEVPGVPALLTRIAVGIERIAAVLEQDSPSPPNTLRTRTPSAESGEGGSYEAPTEAEFQQWFMEHLKEDASEVDLTKPEPAPLFPGFFKGEQS